MKVSLLAAMALLLPALAHALDAQPPAPKPTPVTENLFGVSVTDRWRGMEAMDAATTNWMTVQGDYTESLLHSIASRAGLLQRIAAASASVAQIWSLQAEGGRTFWLEQSGTSATARLMVRDRGGIARVLLDPTTNGPSAAISYYLASPDGVRAAVGIASNGDETTRLFIYDVSSGSVIAGPIDRADMGGLSWTENDGTLFIQRLQNTTDPQARRLNLTAQVWDLKTPPRTVLGAPGSPIPSGPTRRPRVWLTPGSSIAVATVRNGVGNDLEVWTAPAATAGDPKAPWRQVTTESDEVSNFAVHGDDLYFLSHKHAPTFQVLHLAVGQPLSKADVILPSSADRVVSNLQAAADGLWILTRRGLYSELLFAPTGSPARAVALPEEGGVDELRADPRERGVMIAFGNWTTPDTAYAAADYRSSFHDLRLAPPSAHVATNYEVLETEAIATDGARIPLSVISRRGGPPGPRVVRMGGYGAYGVSLTPAFDPRGAPFLDLGADIAVCHVRGGGEMGEAWHLAGKDALKPNTWRDFIACGETLVAKGITTPDRLIIQSVSAGGIMVGRAMEEAPRLFAGVIDAAPVANMLRAETMPGGPANTKEFGSVATEAGFTNLLAMDSVVHVKPGVDYPAVLLITSLNDPRVSPWQVGKFAAALIDTKPKNPILLRVQREGGHDVGATKTQDDALEADADAFTLWRGGNPDWQPRMNLQTVVPTSSSVTPPR